MKKAPSYITAAAVFLAAVFLTACIPPKQTAKPSSIKQESTIPSGWKSYENKESKLSFQYPQDWDFNVIRDDAEMLSIGLSKEDQEQEKVMVYEEMTPLYQINVMVSPNPENLSAKESRLKQFGESSRAQEEQKLQQVSYDGVDGVKFPEGAAPSSGPSTVVLLAKNNRLYNFTYSAMAHQDTHEKFISDFNTLLSSIKFLNE